MVPRCGLRRPEALRQGDLDALHTKVAVSGGSHIESPDPKPARHLKSRPKLEAVCWRVTVISFDIPCKSDSFVANLWVTGSEEVSFAFQDISSPFNHIQSRV